MVGHKNDWKWKRCSIMYSRADEYRKRRRNISLEDLKSVSINMHVCKQAKGKIFDWFLSQIAWHAGICASSCVIKNAYKGECGSVSPAFYRAMPSHSLFCVWSDSAFIFFFISPPYSVFYSNFICKTHLHNVWVVAISLSCILSLNFTAE